MLLKLELSIVYQIEFIFCASDVYLVPMETTLNRTQPAVFHVPHIRLSTYTVHTVPRHVQRVERGCLCTREECVSPMATTEMTVVTCLNSRISAMGKPYEFIKTMQVKTPEDTSELVHILDMDIHSINELSF